MEYIKYLSEEEIDEIVMKPWMMKGLKWAGKYAATTAIGLVITKIVGEMFKPMTKLLNKVHFKSEMLATIKNEVTLTLDEFAKINGISNQFVQKNAKAIATAVMKDKKVQSEMQYHARALSQDPQNVVIQRQVAKNISDSISRRGVEIMADRWKKEQPAGIAEAAKVSFHARRMMHEAGVYGARPAAVNISFIDGGEDDRELITITKGDRSLQIDPYSREAWLDHYTRRVHLGAIGSWTEKGIRALVQRFLGDISDAAVHQALRSLGVLGEATTTSKISVIPIGMAREPINPGLPDKRKGRKSLYGF